MKKYRKRNGAKKDPTFVARAERAFRRVAGKVRAEKSQARITARCLGKWNA
jgi:hypothetical protein